MLNLRLKELIVGLFFTLVHIVFYQQVSHTVANEKPKHLPILLEILPPKPKPKLVPPPIPKPKPEPKKIPPKPVEPPKPIIPPKPIKPPKPKKALAKPPKETVKKTEVKRVVEKPELQQESLVKVQAEEVVEKEVVERPQQLSEPDVKKPDNKPEEKVVEAPAKPEPEPEPEPVHEPVISEARYEGSALNGVYPDEAREQGIEGTVKIKIQVLENGCMGNATVIKSSGSDILDNAALKNISECDFQPRTKDGVPVKSSVIIPVRFRLGN
jgi:protein TonB